MTSCFCASARRAARLLTSLYDAELSDAGISASQFELLTLLSHSERNGRAIARALELDTTTVSRNLKPLLAEGLIRASSSQKDARQLRYGLTPSGRSRLQKASVLWTLAQTLIEARLQQPASHVLCSLSALGEAARAQAS